MMYTYVHGGDVYTASGKKNLADYSANINPLGLPQSVKKAIVKSMCGLSGSVLPPLNGKTGRIFSRARGIHFFQQRCSRCTV